MSKCGISKKTLVGILLLLIFTSIVVFNNNHKPSPVILNVIMVFTTIAFSYDTLEMILNKKNV